MKEPVTKARLIGYGTHQPSPSLMIAIKVHQHQDRPRKASWCSGSPRVWSVLREAVGIDGQEQYQGFNEGVDPLVRRGASSQRCHNLPPRMSV